MIAYCPVCDKNVPVFEHPVVDLNPRLSIRCHGTTESKTFSDAVFALARRIGRPQKVQDWLDHVFETDMQPDVMLAIRYAQGRTMKEPQ